jgi:hypothetical protein
MHLADEKLGLVALAVTLGAACMGDVGGNGFVPEPGDEAIDPSDPPTDPDPDDPGERLVEPLDIFDADGGTVDDDGAESDEGIATAAFCRARSRMLSPAGLTFIIHISKNPANGAAAVQQLEAVRHLIRARDIFMIEGRSPHVTELREEFPCNRIDFIAYPDELSKADDLRGEIGGIAIDWERPRVRNHSQRWSVNRLKGFSRRIHERGQVAGVVPYWPGHFNDGHILRASRMNYELAQIQDDCAFRGPQAFANAARRVVRNFRRNGLNPRRVGFEISSLSYSHAPRHTGVDRSARCTNAAYRRGGARAIYLYGNGHPHIARFFRRIHRMGLRKSH